MKLASRMTVKTPMFRLTAFLLTMSLFLPAWAGQVEIRFVELTYTAGTWRAAVTLAHGDTGWNHYADGWRLVTTDGKVLGHRTLWHPHEHEQPFTRSLSDIPIPADIKTIMVEAHDKVHGWSPDKVEINMSQDKGKRYRINR